MHKTWEHPNKIWSAKKHNKFYHWIHEKLRKKKTCNVLRVLLKKLIKDIIWNWQGDLKISYSCSPSKNWFVRLPLFSNG
jgi:hypothetical protein